MNDTLSIDRFLEIKALWEEYTELCEEIQAIESNTEKGYLRLWLERNVGTLALTSEARVPLSKSKAVNILALHGAMDALKSKRDEVKSLLSSKYGLEV